MYNDVKITKKSRKENKSTQNKKNECLKWNCRYRVVMVSSLQMLNGKRNAINNPY